MRRSICFCEPSAVSAGEIGSWKFIYTTANKLPKGTKLRFDLGSKGRNIDWEVPSVDLKKGSNVICGVIGKDKIIPATEISIPNSIVPQYEFTLPLELAAGGNFTIVLGAKGKKDTKKATGNRAQLHAQRRRPFFLYIDPSGKKNYGDPEIFTLDIRGNKLHTIRILAPSFVTKNRRFDLIVRCEDEHGNLTSDAPEDTLIELSYEHLRESLNWKLFIPETGFIALPNLYFNEVGIYTVQLRNTKNKEVFRSAPIKCFSENNHNLFWGVLHGESERMDSAENIESCLRHFRDDKALNFFACSPFESQEETSNEMWKLIGQNIAEFNEEDRFTTFLGFQWVGEPSKEGIRQMIYGKDHKQVLRKKDAKNNALKKIYKSFAPKELISIPCFTMAKGFSYNFDDFAPEYERVVEIYNSWGSSECLAKEKNPVAIKSSNKKGVQETAEGTIIQALLRNCRFGFIAGGLDDRGIYSSFYEKDQLQYPPGLTAIIASEHTKNALCDALYNRSCYATTGERMIVGLHVAGAPMGKEISSADKPGLLVNRHLSGYVAGTTVLEKVEIMRNGTVLKTFKPEDYSFEFAFDDLTPLEKVAVKSKDKRPAFVFYYLRATQQDGHMAWSSPIWVDLLPPSKAKLEAQRAAKKTIAEPIVKEEDEFDNIDEMEE